MTAMNIRNNSEASAGKYCAQISEAGLQTLQGLIGRRIQTIYAPCLQVAGAHLTSPSFSVPLSDEIGGKWIHKYVNFSCEWFEAPLTLTDYWKVLVSIDDKPRGIDVDSTGAIVSPCTIHFYGSNLVKQIEVFEFHWTAGQGADLEAVTYDNAIRFELEGGKALCIACQLNGPGIATEVHFSDNEALISEFLEGCCMRTFLTPM
jgi:hypothetical protein